MPSHMTFTLDGNDRLSRVLDRAGDNAANLDRRLARATTGMSGNVKNFTQDASGRLRTLDGRFASTADSARVLGDRMDGVAPSMRTVGQSAAGAGAEAGGMGSTLYWVAGIAALSLLPALGALVPMMLGLGLAAATLKLGLNGVTDAVAAASTGKKEYAAALKKLSPEARTFTKALVGLKKEFSGIGKDIQKAMLPGFTTAVKAAGPYVKILGRGMTEMGKGFGDAARGASRLMKDGGFQHDFAANLQMGNRFVRELTGSMGPFVKSLLDFGAASGPTLNAFSSGISGLLGKGLPGLFQGLQTGIGGSAKFLDGIFDAVNRLLPALGRFSGEVARSAGPALGEMASFAGKAGSVLLNVLGGAVKWLSPVFRELQYGVKDLGAFLAIIGPTVKDTAGAIFGSFLPAFSQVDKAKGPLQNLTATIERNKGAIQEASRQFGNGVITMVAAGVSNLPTLIGAFRVMAGGIVTALGGILHGAASAFGWIPGIGGKLKSADAAFGRFKTSFINGLSDAEAKTRAFAAQTLPKLEQGKLKMNISNWQSQIDTAKAKLKTVPPSKRAALLASISDLQNKVAQARAALNSIQSKTVSVMVQYKASKMSPFAKAAGGYASGGKPKPGELAWVGEEGPELMKFGGSGTEIYSHGESMAMVSDAAKAGRDAGLGLRTGMGASTAAITASGRSLGAAVLSGIRDELEIASPSKKTKALAADAGRGIIVGLTGSKAKISATAKDLVKDIWAAWKGTKSTKDSRLVAMVNADNAKLQALASKRDALASKIAAAKAYRTELTSNAKSAAGLSSLGLAEEDVSAGSIQASLSQKLSKINMFARYVQSLAKRGLNKNLLQQVLNMGPDQGYAYASALAGMGTGALRAVNATQSNLDKAAGTLGSLGADAMYDSGSQAGKGFLAGLTAQQKAIEAQMLKIAKGMQAAIKKALGIKSPSRVMAQLGRYTTQGLAVGLTEALPHIDRAMGVVAGRVASGGLGVALPAGGGGGGRGGSVTNLYVTIPGVVVNPPAAAREIVTLLQKYGRYNGRTITIAGG